MSRLKKALEADKFPVVAELQPPKGIALDNMFSPVGFLKKRVTAFSVPDNEHARLRLSSLAACRLLKEADAEPLLHLTCRDRNRLALESDLLGAAVLGINNVLVVSGDYVTLGDHPQAKPVYDADSVQLLQIAQGLMAGHDSAGLPLNGNPDFFLGAVVIPEADPWVPQLIKFEKKVAAGAQFFITPAVFDLEKFRAFRQSLPPHPIKILASIEILGTEEVAQAKEGKWRQVYSLPPEILQELTAAEAEKVLFKGAEIAGRLLKQLKEENLADGVYLKAQGRADLFTMVLEGGGL
ncbi:MAG: methylenetetrahydrofolate reductase [Desulfobaccales bacterium]|nr:methylenetetrahydrofolate reductase [Desulfobaccales bacterium]